MGAADGGTTEEGYFAEGRSDRCHGHLGALEVQQPRAIEYRVVVG